MDKFAAAVGSLWNALLSVGKTIVFSRWRTGGIERIERPADELVVLGNGPSLKGFLEEKSAFLTGKDLLCVNYAAESPRFEELKPRYYVAVDPVVYRDGEIERAFGNLARKTAWELHLFVPSRYRKMTGWREAVRGNPHIRVHLINITPVEGTEAICFPLYRARLGMPRPRNVLIPALMCGLWTGYRTLYTVGVEHTWHLQLHVDEQNRLMIDDRHFYDTGGDTVRRHGRFRMDTLFRSLYIVFASYHTIERFSRRLGARIFNITDGSFIDAFERLCV
jgi:hypothetical protein